MYLCSLWQNFLVFHKRVIYPLPQYPQVDLLTKETLGGPGSADQDKVEQYMRSYVIAWPADRLSSKPSRVPFSDLVIGS